MDVLDFNREEPLCCKNYGTWNQCFHCLKGGEVWGDSQVGWITALSDTVGIAMARQPCLLIVCFIFSAFQKKNAFHKEHWLRAYPCSSGLYLILQQGTIWGPSNAWEIPHNCWYQHEIMFVNHQCSVSTYILRNWSMTQMHGTQSHALEGSIVNKPCTLLLQIWHWGAEELDWTLDGVVSASFAQGQRLKSLGIQSFPKSSFKFLWFFVGLCKMENMCVEK